MATVETITGEHWQIRVGDVMDGLASLADSSVHCCVTSPPYWGLRDYGFDGQIGSEKTPGEFVAKLVAVFAQVRRVLRDDGVLFVNLGDSYATGGGSVGRSPGGGDQGERFLRAGMIDTQPNRMKFGMAAGNKIGVPWRFALEMQDAGWILRQDVIWSKPAPMPESVRGTKWVRCRVKTVSGIQGDPVVNGMKAHSGDIRNTIGPGYYDCPGCDKCRDTRGLVLRNGSWRPTTSHEYIFQFVKSRSYFCDGDGSKETAVGGTPGNKTHKGKTAYEAGDRHHRIAAGLCDMGAVEARNQRSVWCVTSEPFKGAHFATFPTELPRRCLIAATSRGGCCSACAAQYAPVVESKRVATRPGTNSKVNRASDDADSPYHPHSGDMVGNRDPQRHTTTTVVTGYLPTCRCNATTSRPIVLDPFGGSMTTGQVAINMGCDFIGLEGNAEYAKLGITRLQTPWVPVSERKKPTKPKRRLRLQRELF